LKQIHLFGDAHTFEEMVSNAVEVLENLGPGTWEFYEHPGKIIQGEEGAWHIGAEDDALYRDKVTRALTSEKLKRVIKRRNIRLMGYDELRFWHF
jgi:hypothetical protein